ncbi:MAG: 3-deoxy-7-phosphoheptulonate synthase [Sedimentisphaeraceae bacterium JB056]
MRPTDNLNIVELKPLITPRQLREQLPLSDKQAKVVLDARDDIKSIITHRDKRMLVITGPCSIHDEASALDYASRLAKLQEKYSDKVLIVMRAYFEKPRTTIGWKGMLYDPDLNGSYNMEKGLRQARDIMLKIIDMGLPVATEVLEPIVPQYITDLISWVAIGARTTESQIHRQMVSGLSMPIGFKNATDGSLDVAVQAIKTARNPHYFFGIDIDGRVAVAETRGNIYTHFVLRGGTNGPNYETEYIAFAEALLKKARIGTGIIVDCSHGNSFKDYRKQADVINSIVSQKREGNKSIVGVMLESFIEEGSQNIDAESLKYGLSITDACIGWDKTESLITKLANI